MILCKYEYHPFTRLKALGFEMLVYLIFLAKARTRYHGARAGNHGLGSKQTSVPVFHIKLFRRNFIQTSVNCLKSKYEKRYGCPTLNKRRHSCTTCFENQRMNVPEKVAEGPVGGCDSDIPPFEGETLMFQLLPIQLQF